MSYTVYPKFRYVPGAFKRESDCCGFDFLSTELVQQWNGLWVCPKCLDPKPRDIVNKKPPVSTNIRIF